jgi:hypothetical protein
VPDHLIDELGPDNDDKWEAFHIDTCGMEDDNDALNRAIFDDRLAKEGEEQETNEETRDVATPHMEDVARTKSQPIPHNALHMHAHSYTLVPQEAPDEEEVTLRNVHPRRQHVAQESGQMLVE